MSFAEWSKKKKNEQGQQSSAASAGSSTPSFAEWSKNKAASSVDQNYINTFIRDANDFLGSAEKHYGLLEWGNASALYDAKSTAWNDLDVRSKAIRTWLNQNKSRLDEKTYNEFASMLDDVDRGSISVVSSFRNAKDFYGQFDTLESYNAWQKSEDEKQALMNSYGFDNYAIKGKTSAATLKWWGGLSEGNKIEAYRGDAGMALSAQGMRAGSPAYEEIAQAQAMTEDEAKIYNYYYGKYGEEKANEYFEGLKDTLNARIAVNAFANIEGNLALEYLAGIVTGLDQFASGIKNLFADGESKIPTSSGQYLSGMIREDLVDVGAQLPDWLGGGSLGQMGFDMVSTTANMLPSILIGTIPVVGGVLGSATLGASAAGNAYAEMINLGYTKEQARAYGLLVGGSEGVLQYFLGGIGKLGGKLSGNAIGKFVNLFDNALARTAIKLGGNMAAEGLEEAIQEVLDPVFKSWTTGEDFEGVEWDQVLYSGLLGALSAGVLEGGSTISGEVKTYKVGKEVREAGGIKRLTDLGETLAADTVAYKLANKVTNNTGAYTIGRLFQEVGATLSEQNVAEITAALEEKGMSKKTAAKLAKQYQSFLNGEMELTDARVSVMESLDPLSDVLRKNIIGKNTTVYQRTRAYADVLDFAEEVSGAKAAEQNASVPLSSKELARREALAKSGDFDAIVREMSAQSDKFAYNSDGKTTLSRNNKEVSIKEIASIDEGKIKLRLDNGEVVDAKEVAFKSDEEALLYENIVHMGLNAATANSFIKGFEESEGLSAQEYAMGFAEAYRYGTYGFSASEMTKKGFSASLSEEQRHRAYTLGKIDGEAAVKEAQKARTEAKEGAKASDKKTAAKKGKVFLNGKEFDLSKKTGLKGIRDTSVRGMAFMADALGVDVYFYESYKTPSGKRVYRDEDGTVKKAPHGFYDPNTGRIYIDLNAGKMGEGVILYTAAHELTHFIRDWSPAKFKVFADFLIENYAKKGVNLNALVQAQIQKAKKNGRDISYDEAYEEMVADSCQAMLADGKVIEKLAELKKQDLTLWEKIREFIADLVAKIKKVYKRLDPYSVEGRFVKEKLDIFEDLQNMWVDALVDAGETYSEVREALGENSSVKVNEDGEFLMGKTEDGTILLNDRTWTEGGRDTLMATLALEGYSDEGINAALTIMDAKHELVQQLGKEIAEQDKMNKATLTTDLKTGKAVLSALVSNGDYPVNIDLLMVCKKRQAYQRVINRLCETGLIKKATIDSLAIAEINKILGKYGFETACLGCFVESRRIRIQEWAETICKEWNGIVDKMVGKGKAESFNFASETFVKDLSNNAVNDLSAELESAYERDGLKYGRVKVVKKMEQLMREVPSLRKHLSVADLITPQGRTNLKRLSSELNSLVACRYGSNAPKIVQDFNPYNHELATYGKVPSKYSSLREYLYAIGGARMQSFSDFIVENWFDYCQIVADLSARKLPMHTYTKEIVLAKLFGMTGIKINMSLIPDIDKSLGEEYAGLTRNAKGELELIWGDKDRYKATGGKSYMQSINFADAVKLMEDPRYSANVGTIAVGVSDMHIRMMLDDSRIRMVIPYHSSGMKPIFAHLVGTEYYKDYTDFQNTGVEYLVDSNGKKVTMSLSKTQKANLTSGFEFNEVLQELGDARTAAQAYIDWCADASKHSITIDGVTYNAVLTPKFNDFSDHGNYYKLLEDFNTYDSITEQAAPQGDVQQVYPEEFEDILRGELNARENYRAKQEPKWDTAMGEIEAYLKKHTKKETVDYAKEHGIKLSKKDMKLSDRDSEGNTLSEEQQEFFKDSKVRDEEGRLLVLHRGSPEDFGTVFRFLEENLNSKDQPNTFGFFFTDSHETAEYYSKARGNEGDIKTVYLNIEHPLDLTSLGISSSEKEFYRLLEENGVITGRSRYKQDYKPVWTRFDKNGESMRRSMESAGFDGVVYHDWGENKATYVAFYPEQIKSITNEAPTSNPDIRYSDRDSYAPVFYSHMGKVIDEIKLAKMGAGGVVSYLKGKGVKNEEIKWSGIEAFLEGKKSVTKEELQAFVAGSQLQIVEQMSNTASYVDEDGNTYSDTEFKNRAYAIAEQQGIDRDRVKFVLDPDDGSYVAYAGNRFSGIILEAEADTSNGALGRWSEYKLEGGSNYRELVFQMPDSSYSNRAMRGHWGQDAEGVLAHARIQDFDTAKGKMLFIEEIQSDWHNEGHSKGYSTKEYEDAVESQDKLYNEYKKLDLAFHKYVRSNDFMTDPEDVRKKKHDWLRGKAEAAYEKYLKAKTEVDSLKKKGAGDTPDAPFSDTYHEYVLKRLLRMAAEEGYDVLGWTPSEIQSERWSEDYAEAYRIEYDQEMPKFLRKYGKKWGATVGQTMIMQEEYTVNGEHYDAETIAVWSMNITDSMKQSVLHEGQPLYSDRSDSDISNRELLANALESAAQNDIERNKLAQYKDKIKLINAEEQKLHELKAKIGELSFAKGRKDTEQINKLKFDAKQTENRINTYDRQLLNLEASKPLKDVLEREKKLAYKKAEKKGKDALAAYKEKAAETQRKLLEKARESRQKGIEGRRKTEMRHKIKDIVSDLNKLLLKPTKDKHVPIQLQKPVAEALDIINMDTVGAEERVARYNDLIAKAKTLEEAEALTKSRDRILEQGENLNEKLTALKNAYAEIKNSDDPLVANAHDDVISAKIDTVIKVVGETALRDMSLEQLEEVYELYRMVYTTISNANKTFKQQKNESISTRANRVMAEVDQIGGKTKLRSKGRQAAENYDWNNQKPIYAFERIGSTTFTEHYNAVRAGEDTWAQDVSEARQFYIATCKKHGYNTWDMSQKFTFKSTSGMEFDLSLEMILSLYAYSKRGKQAVEHIKNGGIVIDNSTEVTVKTKLGFKKKFNVEDATTYNISEQTLSDIISKMTPEQKAFADEMQEYLSSTMGAKGNEVSLELYGIKLFKEKFYFPLKSSSLYMPKTREQDAQKGEVKIKNYGMTKETVEGAKNPIVLSPFVDVWANHVNEMSMYHAFVLPMEDFYRVYNYHTPTSDQMATESVQAYIQNAYGKAAISYIDQLLKDLNGGAVSDPREGIAKNLMTKFKKAKTMLSLSVVIQQPTSIVRAMALLDAKYFAGKKVSKQKHGETWEEVKKYAPVAIIKEMGYFDTNMGRSATDFITGQDYHGFKEKTKALFTDSGFRDEAFSKLPALADEIAWCSIWNAVKRETVHKHKDLRPNSEEFLKVCGERFTEVVTKTQVYDSTLSRSGWMRSKSGLVNMWTAFLGEPTTSINMIQNAILSIKRGSKALGAKQIGAVLGSVVFNAALVSLVYAMRDDDEDETYAEKYLSRFTTEVLEGINPVTYLPFVKDIWSVMQGYDVERTDMALVTDLWNSFEKVITTFAKDTDGMTEEELEEHYDQIGDAIWGIVGSISSMVGLPVENIHRDMKGIANFVGTVSNGKSTTFGSLVDKVWEEVKNSIPIVGKLAKDSKSDTLYDAIISGDEEYVARLKEGYKSDSAYSSAIRKALRENDPRIKEAAQAAVEGDFDKYTKITNEIIGEGHFSEEDVVAAIRSEYKAMTKDEEEPESEVEDKDVSIYEMEYFYSAVKDGNVAMAYAIKEDIIQTAVANGKELTEAENSFNNSFKYLCQDEYEDGNISDYEVVNLLVSYGGKTKEDAAAIVAYWDFKIKYPDYDLSQSAVENYTSYCESVGVSVDIYYKAWKYKNSLSGTVKEPMMQYINNLPLTAKQKDSLYYAFGWKASTIWQAPWH